MTLRTFHVILLSSIMTWLMSGCAVPDEVKIDLSDNWEYAIATANSSPMDSTNLYQPIEEISELTRVLPEGGVVYMKKVFDLNTAMLNQPLALMLGRIVKADRTYLNGSNVGSTGNFPPNATNPWSINRIYSAPGELLKLSNNQLIIEIYFETGRGGIFDDPMIGHRRQLENHAALRRFYYVDTYKTTSILSLFGAIIFFIIYLKRKQDRAFLFYSLSLLAFAFWGMYHYIWSIPFLAEKGIFDALWFNKFLWSAVFIFPLLNSLFIKHFLDRNHKKLFTILLYGTLVLTVGGLWLSPDNNALENFRKTAFIGLLIYIIVNFSWIAGAIKDEIPNAKRMFAIYFIYVGFSFYDVYVDMFNLYLPYLAPVSIPLYLFGIALLVINEYVNANNEVERISKVLDHQNIEIAQKNEELSKLDKLKDQFLANTSHELRTPLNGIIGLAESLMDGATGPLPHKTNLNLSMIINSGKRLTSLIGDLLDFSKIKSEKLSLHKESVYIGQITELVIALSNPLIGGRPVEIINDIPSGLAPVYGDDHRIEQIMFNLIGNAIKFTHEGHIKISGKEVDGMIEVSIEDTGIGIPEEKFEDIFKDFQQVESDADERIYEGTGLGLSITKKLIELHGGKIWLTSEIDKGSTFTFSLPKGDATEIEEKGEFKVGKQLKFESKEEEELNISIGDDQFYILVVDDEPVNLQVLTNQLELQNYKVRTASNGMEALKIMEEDIHPDLLILDVMMPKMSGFEVCQKIRTTISANNLPIILLTAKDRISDLTEGFNAGANDYLVKPFSKRELATRIKTHLNLSKINNSYSRFVPNEFIEFLNKESIVEVKLGDQIQKTMSVLFIDIRDFTSLSELMSPKENFEFLNGYLERIGPCIRSHGGFIDKYIGDGVMALFPDTPDSAVAAAIDLRRHVGIFNHMRIDKGFPAIRIGIGVNTGSMILGTIGETARLQSTVISDSVNLASRMEGLTKTYGVPLLISKKTYDLLENKAAYHARMLDRVRVKGKQSIVTVMEIYDGDDIKMIDLKDATKSIFEEAVALYQQKEVDASLELFKKVIATNPNDNPALLYIKRCTEIQNYGSPDKWEGITEFKT